MSNLSKDPRNDPDQVRITFTSQVLRERVSVSRDETSFNSKSNSVAVDRLPRIYQAKRKSGRNQW